MLQAFFERTTRQNKSNFQPKLTFRRRYSFDQFNFFAFATAHHGHVQCLSKVQCCNSLETFLQMRLNSLQEWIRCQNLNTIP